MADSLSSVSDDEEFESPNVFKQLGKEYGAPEIQINEIMDDS
jgi:hypothetical protein